MDANEKQSAKEVVSRANDVLNGATHLEESLKTPSQLRLFGLGVVLIGLLGALLFVALFKFWRGAPLVLRMPPMLAVSTGMTWGFHSVLLGKPWDKSGKIMRGTFMVVGAMLSIGSILLLVVWD